MTTDPNCNPIDDESDDEPLFYDLTNEGNEDAWLDRAYEDRFDIDYEPAPAWEY